MVNDRPENNKNMFCLYVKGSIFNGHSVMNDRPENNNNMFCLYVK